MPVRTCPFKTPRVAIIGAGPAGLAAAYVLSKSLPSLDVYESTDHVGGLSRSFSLWGQTVDLGPHRFFSRDRRVNALWLEVVGGNYVMVRRHTRILYGNRFYNYPLNAANVLTNLGPLESALCLASYARQVLLPTADAGDFQSWASRRFGRRLFQHFFRYYSEKLWGIPCTELDADFAAQRIKQFSLGEAIKGTFSRAPRSEHRTLVDEFAYPSHGSGMVYERMAEVVASLGGTVRLNMPVKRVLAENGLVYGIELNDGAIERYDAVISTMPLTQLVQRLPNVPSTIRDLAGRLRYRNTILVYLEIADSNVCPDNWLYIHHPELHTGRITNFRNWAPQICGASRNTILALEYWCNSTGEMWKAPDAAMIDLATKEVLATGLVTRSSLIQRGVVYRVPKCYPVYHKGYRALITPIQQYLNAIRGLQVIGRYGSFKYNNQDHSLLMGILAASNIAEHSEHDLWDVNCDYDAYQEGARITDTGLVAAASGAP